VKEANAQNGKSEISCSKARYKRTPMNLFHSSDFIGAAFSDAKEQCFTASLMPQRLKSGVIAALSAFFVELFVNRANIILHFDAYRKSFEWQF
jgi:hypothetical protein